MSVLVEAAIVQGRRGADVHPYRCHRCAKILGVLAPGRFWLRLHGRTVLYEGGGRVTVWCERCGAEHIIDPIGNPAPSRT